MPQVPRSLRASLRPLTSLAGTASVALALALGACAQQGPPPGTATASGDAVPNDNGIASISKARCERQAQCHNLGGGDDKERRDCVRETHDALAKGVGPDACTQGISRAGLDKCISALQYQLCEGALGPVDGFEECRASHLCAK